MASVTHFWPSGSTVMLCGSVGGWFSMHRSDIDCPGCLDRLNKETKAVTVAEVVAASERRRASPPPSRTQGALERALAEVNAIKQRNALARDRADAAGREVVALCRQSGVETCEEIEDRLRALASPVNDAGDEPKETET